MSRGDHSAVRAAAVAAGLGGLAALRLVLPAATPRIRGLGSVAVLEKVRIGGSDQWVLERSEDVGNPVLLFLHGGPGTSQLTSNRRDTRALEKYFTVVNWDQQRAQGTRKAADLVRPVGAPAQHRRTGSVQQDHGG
jgi:pimeloyl-ACP methyl ester carboxylesterase